MHLKRNKTIKFKKKNIIILIIILVMFSIIKILIFFNSRAIPFFTEYSEIETEKIISSIITTSVNEAVSNYDNIDNFLIIEKGNNQNIKSIDFNSKVVNVLLKDICKIVTKNLKYIELGELDKINGVTTLSGKDNVIYKIPSGLIFNNGILVNIFPSIPVKLNIIGNTMCKLNTDIKSYGINNSMITINVDVISDVKILLPFTSKKTTITASVPLVIKLVEGEIPNYYLNGYLNSPVVTG